MHLSAPEGISINDYIDKKDFPIHYATVDDAVAMVTEYSKGCIMAKIDPKAAFHMIPIVAEEWDLLGLHWRGSTVLTPACPSVFSYRSSSTSLPLPFTRSWPPTDAADLIHYLDA